MNFRYISHNNTGFTLLELVIAITILSLLTLLIGGGFRLGLNAWEKGEAETVETQKLRILSGMISQQLKSAYPYKMNFENENVVLFQGEADSLLFATALTDSSEGGFKWIRYSYKDNVLLYKDGILPDKMLKEKIEGDDKVMDSDIEELRFSYFSAREKQWLDKWEFGTDLPAAVKVKISYFQPFFISIPMGTSGVEDEILEEITREI